MSRCPRCGRSVHIYELTLVRDEAEEICKDCAYFRNRRNTWNNVI